MWGLAWQGSTPIGGPIVGWIGTEFGPRYALLVGGVPTLLLGIAVYPLLARTHRAAMAEAVDADVDGPQLEARSPDEATNRMLR